MKKAKEMFEQLGYEQFVFKPELGIKYRKKENKDIIEIDFDGINRKVYKCRKNFYEMQGLFINMQELEAINQMCRELEWYR